MQYYKYIRPSYLYLLNIYNNNKYPIRVAEIGVNYGENITNMLKANNKLLVTLVDKDKDILTTDVLKNKNVRFINKLSVEAAEDCKDRYFDYIYIDADHKYDSVYNDLKAWYPKLKVGGVMAGHDWWLLDVRYAVKDFTKHLNPKVVILAIDTIVPFGSYIEVYPKHIAEMMDWWFVKPGVKNYLC